MSSRLSNYGIQSKYFFIGDICMSKIKKNMPLDPMTTAQFYMGNSDFVEKKDLENIKAYGLKGIKYFGIASVLGVSANVYVSICFFC